ncbi:2-hydroxyacid dehydrogenase [Fodinicurvata sp. EGI_FJ10296]|uniref:2-hydroxyacid dehydrogenase n=1 Tax=Fodinicurvata sp. EGI_FJ10296 TaxID=3231908 RepID=UPI0034573805
MKPNVLVLGPKMPGIIDLVSEFANPVAHWDHGDLDACQAAAGGPFRGVLATGESRVTRAFQAELPELEIIGCFGVGYDGIDVEAALERGIAVTNTPGVLTEDVADLAVGLMITVRRNMVQADRYIRDGRWEREGPMPLAGRVQGKKVGLVGLGRIGLAIARRLEAFNCTIAYHKRTRLTDSAYPYVENLVELASASDILVVSTPGGRTTEGMIDRSVLRALGPEGTLVNIARGSVVDEQALIETLKSGELGSAALDVFRDEPRVPDALKRLPNVVLTPHIGSATSETRHAMRDLVLENLRNHFDGKPLVTPVPEMG